MDLKMFRISLYIIFKIILIAWDKCSQKCNNLYVFDLDINNIAVGNLLENFSIIVGKTN